MTDQDLGSWRWVYRRCSVKLLVSPSDGRTFAEILDKLNYATRNTLPLAQLHLGCVTTIVLFYQADGI